MSAASRQTGFSLPEILVVIAIIGILSAISYAFFANAKAQARDRARLAGLETLRVAVEQYKDKYGKYPDKGCGVAHENIKWSGSETYTSSNYAGCDQYIVGLVPEFISSLPREPGTNKVNRGYVYKVAGYPNNTGYIILSNYNVEVLRVSSQSDPYAYRPDFCSSFFHNTVYSVYSDETTACY